MPVSWLLITPQPNRYKSMSFSVENSFKAILINCNRSKQSENRWTERDIAAHRVGRKISLKIKTFVECRQQRVIPVIAINHKSLIILKASPARSMSSVKWWKRIAELIIIIDDDSGVVLATHSAVAAAVDGVTPTTTTAIATTTIWTMAMMMTTTMDDHRGQFEHTKYSIICH